MASDKILGDMHNFRRAVIARDELIVKFRPCVWEDLLLNFNSSLRKHLRAINRKNPRLRTDFLPDLTAIKKSEFEFHITNIRRRLKPLGSLTHNQKNELALVAGRLFAVSHFFGLTDLHAANLALGLDKSDRIVFGPVDIEIVLEKLAVPLRCLLLPMGGKHGISTAGFTRVLDKLGRRIEPSLLLRLLIGYWEQWEVLWINQRRMFGELRKALGKRKVPIRYLLRPTRDYRTGRGPRLPEEIVQIARGDIPYFFRYFDRPVELYYYISEDLKQIRRVKLNDSLREDLRTVPLIPLMKGWTKKEFLTTRAYGLALTIAAFDKASWRGRYEYDGYVLLFDRTHFNLLKDDFLMLAHPRRHPAVKSIYRSRGRRVGGVLTPIK